MRKKINYISILIALVISSYSGIAQSCTMQFDITTGVGIAGTNDPNWTVQLPANPPITNPFNPVTISTNTLSNGVTTWPNAYALNTCGNYLSPFVMANGNITNAGALAGVYTYQMTFNVPFTAVSSAILNIPFIAADDFINSMTINGFPVAVSGSHMIPGSVSNLSVPVTPGVNTIQVTHTNNGGYTGFQLCGDITVSSHGWQQHTKSVLTGPDGPIINDDDIFDVITDLDGNVFVTGKFVDQTVLNGGIVANDLILQDAQNVKSNSFIAKYNPCGDLIWAAQSSTTLNQSNFETDRPSRIALDEDHNLVYIVGEHDGDLTFNSSNICTPTSSLTLLGNPSFLSNTHAYVAAFDMTSGCIQFLEDPFDDPHFGGTAIAINETNGDVFVAGILTATNSGTTSFIKKFPFSGGSTLGTHSDGIHVFSNSVVTNNNNPNTIKGAVVSDMDFNEANSMLYIVGTLKSPDALEFTQYHQPTGPVTNTYVGTPIISMSNTYPGSNPPLQPMIASEAYIMAFRDIGSPTVPLSFINMKRGGSVDKMSANAVSVDNNTGEVYIVGEYRLDGWQTASNGIPAFTFGGPGSILTYKWLPNTANSPSAGGGGAYLVKLDWQLENGWATYTSTISGNGYTEATGVSAKNGRAYITGVFLGEDMTFDPAAGLPSLPYQLGTASSGGVNPILSSRAFVACYNSSGTGDWANATTLSNPSIQNGHHYSHAISADDWGNAYVVGMYNENLDYLYSAVPTAALNSNHSSPQVPRNGFVLRLEDNNLRPNGSLSRKKKDQLQLDIIDTTSANITIYPNPATDQFKMYISKGGDYQIVIYDLSGKKVLEQNTSLENGQILEFDLQKFSNGTYIVKCVGEEVIKTKHLVITNK